MAIRAIGKNERIDIEVEGVTLQISRVTSAERQKVQDRFQKRGVVQEREVMDTLLQRHVHGYTPDLNDDNTWVFDADGEFVDPVDFNPKIILGWAESVKTEIYDKMHENELGQDTRTLDADGEGRVGNSMPGSVALTNLTD